MNTLKFRKLKELSSNLYFLILFFCNLMTILADLNTITVTQGSKKSIIFNLWPIMTLFCTIRTLHKKTIKDYFAFVKSVDRSTPASKWHAKHLTCNDTPKSERQEKRQFKTNRYFNRNRNMTKKGVLSALYNYIG